MRMLRIPLGILAFSTHFLSVLAAPISDDSIIPRAPQLVSPPLNGVYIEDIQYAGSGCPAGSVDGGIVANGSYINILFDKYMAAAGPGVPITETRKNCQLKINFIYPVGLSYTIYSTMYAGYVDLDQGVYAIRQSDYYFPGRPETKTFKRGWMGKFTENYVEVDELSKIETPLWSPCGVTTSLNINTSIRVDNSGNKKASGIITTDSITHGVRQILGLQWRNCSNPIPPS